MVKKFKNTIEPRKIETGEIFAAPSRDVQTTGYYYPAGNDFGVGFRVNVGSTTVSNESAVPSGCKRMKVEDQIE